MKARNTYLEFDPPLMDKQKLEWLKRRQEGIGGSDAGVCLGVNPYKGLYELYMDKTTQPVDDMNEAMYWGTALENPIIAEFIKRFGIDWDKVILNHEITNPAHVWQRANLDALVTDDPQEGTFIIEAKNVGYHSQDQWGDDFIPEYYYAQCQHNMMVSRTSKCYVPALFCGNKFQIYLVTMDEIYCQKLFDAEAEFWKESVVPLKCPAPDATSRDELLRQHPEATSEEKKPNSKVDSLVEMIEAHADAEKQAKAEKEASRNELALLIGDDEGAHGVIREATWKNNKGKETIDMAAIEKEYPGIVAKFKKTGKPFRTLRLR